MGIRIRVSTRDSSYASLNQMPNLKSNLQAERRNADTVADAVANVIIVTPQATVEWVIDREGEPDFSGFIPDELRQRLGEPKVFHLVCDTPVFLAAEQTNNRRMRI